MSEELRTPDIKEKENIYMSKMIYPVVTFKLTLGVLSIFSGILFWIFQVKGFLGVSLNTTVYLISPTLFILSMIFLRGVDVDIWVPHIASSRVGSSYCKIGLRYITIDYDLLHSKKTIIKFIEEITEKSEDYNYFLHKISPRNMTIKLKVRPKVRIPTIAEFSEEYEENEKWNYIPLGVGLTDKSILGTVNWVLNDQEDVVGDHRSTIPSTSLLIAGGTGSGKSVMENNIIRHINKYSDKFQGVLLDVKRVEFGGLSNIEGIKAVALDIEECKESLESVRAIMNSRFKFMEKAGVNNIYKLKNFKCSYFIISDRHNRAKKMYQFDEIFYAKDNDNIVITTIDEIYKKVRSGNSNIRIYPTGQKSKSYTLGIDGDSNKDLIIREIFAGENFYINGEIFYKDDIVTTETGTIRAVDMYDGIYDRKLEYILKNGVTINEHNCKIVECIFIPKVILVVIDEMTEVMETNNFKAQSSISASISSIARLGRAAACHLCLATQRPSNSVISSDLKNNIQMSTILGDFGSGESMLCFDEDISDFTKPEIKGRGFIKTGNEIIEYQSFFVRDINYNIKHDIFSDFAIGNEKKGTLENNEFLNDEIYKGADEFSREIDDLILDKPKKIKIETNKRSKTINIKINKK